MRVPHFPWCTPGAFELNPWRGRHTIRPLTGSAVAILSRGRYQCEQNAIAIAKARNRRWRMPLLHRCPPLGNSSLARSPATSGERALFLCLWRSSVGQSSIHQTRAPKLHSCANDAQGVPDTTAIDPPLLGSVHSAEI